MLAKKLLIVALTLCSANLFAGTTERYCRHINAYKNDGWTIHTPSNFDLLEKKISTLVEEGKAAGHIVDDISGPILTADTPDGTEILLAAVMFDDLRTDRDEMFGDYAIIYTDDGSDVAEVRWYDGKVRNVVYNPEVLTCISEEPPFVSNSVL